MEPAQLLRLKVDDMRTAGLSARKVEYLVDLAKAIESRQLRLSELNGEDDEIIRTALKSIRGIGDWTVDMYLLFGLARLDVLPSHDLALRRIIVDLYGIDQNDTSIIEKLSERWKPYRSIACWYLYKHGNTKTESVDT
jgi:DNA-3-methyladenine glycosylase II